MNVQNIPRENLVVKRSFVPKLDVFMFCDYSNIELRLLAYYLAASINDTSMADVFIEGHDLHLETAAAIFSKNTADITKHERSIGKMVNFLIVYGGGRYKLAGELGISPEEAAKFIKAFHTRWPGIKFLQAAISERLVERGYIETLWKRRLHPESDHKALNALVQGCAADLMRWAAVRVHGELAARRCESHIVNIIHDELMMDATWFEAPWIARNVPTLMRDPRVEEFVPIAVEIEYSDTTWADKRPWEGASFGIAA